MSNLSQLSKSTQSHKLQDRKNAIILLIGATGKVALVFMLAFGLTLLLMIPVIGLTMYRLSREATLNSLGQAFVEWDAETILSAMWNHPAFLYGSTIAQAIGFIAAAAILYAKVDSKQGWPMGWTTRGRPLSTLGRGSIIGALLITVVFIAMLPMGLIGSLQGQADFSAWSSVGWYAALLALVTVNEEVFVQGYTQGLLRHRLGRVVGLAGSVLLFTLMHALNPGVFEHGGLPLLNTALFGIFLALCRETSGGLWLPIGVHWAWYFVQGCVFGFPVSGTQVPSLVSPEIKGTTWLTGGQFGAEGSLLTTCIIAAAVILMLLRARSLGLPADK